MFKRFRLLLSICTLFVITTHIRSADAQKPQLTDELTEQMLHDVGLYFPSGMTLRSQEISQQNMKSCAYLTVAWDVLPGAPNRIDAAKRGDWHNPGVFVLKSVDPNVPVPPVSRDRWVPAAIWAFGLDSYDQIRSVYRIDDRRFNIATGAPHATMQTKITLKFPIPEDQSITSIHFYEAMSRDDRNWAIHPVGTIQLPKGAQ